jgi:16S rRNA (uracil1498-N3)-methyltransferase
MRVPRIFSDQEYSVGQSLHLDAFASGHICRVLRMKEGRPLILFNGRGGEYLAVLVKADAKQALVEVQKFDSIERESPLNIYLGLALSRGDRFDWAIQKSVELGVAQITPLLCERSDRLADPKRLTRKLEHWNKLVQSACEQSGRTKIPKVWEPASCAEWSTENNDVQGYILAPDGPGIGDQLGQVENGTAVRIAIGPEGGFTETEERLFSETNGFNSVSLGPRVMRTETAPVAAITLFQYFLGDLN